MSLDSAARAVSAVGPVGVPEACRRDEAARGRVADANAGLGTAELAALRENLDEQRAFRLDQLVRLWHGVPARARRAREQAAVAQLEVHTKLCASARMVLADIEAAIERMEQGTYGICEHCRRPTEPARLHVVPQARYCGRCHQAREVRS
ncbi:TraR/DksA family transcriptional regulator [Streptomyces sp. NPDC058685]|uniref:TraR/DksA family transcriptional regulator n=1 Tax=Streptomyces sp. NPDC058685 TaxID=3346598 RepID=UPI003663BA7F